MKYTSSVDYLIRQASSCGIAVDHIALPILNIYRSGEIVQVIAGVSVEYGEFFSKDDVEWLIENTVSNV